MFKKKIWHPWVDEIIKIGEQTHNRGLLSKLVAYCEENAKNTLYIPNSTGISYYLKFSNKFKQVGMLDGKKLWERIK